MYRNGYKYTTATVTEGYYKPITEENTKSNGWYIELTYKITDKITLVGKYYKYKFNFNNNRDSSTEYTLSTNYYIIKKFKITS
jgi:predicted porin